MTERKKRILLVDDEVSFSQLMERMLEDDRFSCRSVSSAQAALDLLRCEVFDLLITDIMMPNMNGIELIQSLRSEFPGLAILVLSGVDDRKLAHQALNLGAYGYLLKPCEEFEVLTQVENAFRRAELEKLSLNYQADLQQQVAERTAELEETNRMLRQQEKLASIGLLAAGIAHEIKTPTGFVATNLSSLKNYLKNLLQYVDQCEQLSRKSLDEQSMEVLDTLSKQLKIDWIREDCEELLDNCSEGVERIQKILKGLRDFSHQNGDERGPVDLNQIIQDSLVLVHNEIKHKAEVHFSPVPLPKIHGSGQRLSQVFINLLVNAAHAIERKGEIRIEAQARDAQLEVRVADTGCGMSEQLQQRIFEPFFTTKQLGVGTGLGLSIVKEIIAEHGGSIQLESQPGKGTCFTLQLPLDA